MKAFVTGTDTDVGKTYASALLTRALRRAGMDTIALKPLCCGSREDAEILRAAADDELEMDDVNPVWFRMPVAPLVASRAEDCGISLEDLDTWYRRVTAGRKSFLIEGAGGWLVPVTDGVTIADMAERLALPVILVVANRLGCINHTLLTLESISRRGLTCSGIILNTIAAQPDDAIRTNRSILEETTGVPILFEISPGQQEIELAIA